MGVGAGLYMYDVDVKKFTFAISSPDKFLFCKVYMGNPVIVREMIPLYLFIPHV